MSADEYYDDEDPDDGGGLDGLLPDGETPEGGGQPKSLRDWLTGLRGWVLIAATTAVQAIFAIVMMLLAGDSRPPADVEVRSVRDFAVDMLGREVEFAQIYQLVPYPGGRRMTVGLDLVLVLGQLPEERVDGAEKPTDREFELFMEVLRDMEPHIRSRVNSLLQQIPLEDYGKAAAARMIKDDIKNYVNDMLEQVDFGSRVRRGIGKRRVTEVLLPMLIRQFL